MEALDKVKCLDMLGQEINIGDMIAVPESNKIRIGTVVRTTQYTIWYVYRKSSSHNREDDRKDAYRCLVLKDKTIELIKESWE